MSQFHPIILDVGTENLRFGCSVDGYTNRVLPNALGTPIIRSDEGMASRELKKELLCDEITDHMKYLDIHRPVVGGLIEDVEMEKRLLDYALNRTYQKINMGSCPVLIPSQVMERMNRESS